MSFYNPIKIKFIVPWLIWLLGALFYFYEFFIQVSPNVMSTELMIDFGVTAKDVGLISGIFFWAYAVMQIPGGVLLDKLGPRKILTSASFLLALACLIFGFSKYFVLACIVRFIMGLGAALALIGVLKLATNWFPHNRFALIIGLTVAIGMTGAIMGAAPLAKIMEFNTWQQTMIYLSIIGFILSCAFLFFVKDRPSGPEILSHIVAPQEKIYSFTEIFLGVFKVIRSLQKWLIALYGLLMFAPSIVICSIWGTPFIQLKYGLSKQEAAGLISLIFIGWIVGCPTTGWLSDKIGKRIPIMLYGAIFALICLLPIIYGPVLPKTILITLLITFGFVSSGFLPAFSIIQETTPAHCKASALGYMNMMNSFGPALLNPLIGAILDWTLVEKITSSSGVPIYTIDNYYLALSVLPISILIAIIIIPFIKETYCKPLYN